MAEERVPEAWVRLPDPDEVRLPAGHPYDFGFVAGMSRLTRAHPRIGRAFRALFDEIMFSPEGVLTRREREMVAAVTAAAQDCTY
jgi:alkylhydroperoxidase/carboxymuconolactone decarboxylase family protein YurZ